MAGIAAKARELVSSNLAALVEKATNPEKMLRLLRAEIEESIISLQAVLTKANRAQGRLEGEIAQLEQTVADWAAKAKLAMDKGREDLARAALLAREAARADADEAHKAFAGLKANSAGAEEAIGQLEAKLSEIRREIAKSSGGEPARNGNGGNSGRAGSIASKLDRIDELERRVNNSQANATGLSPEQIDEELRKLDQDARIEAELDALKQAAAKGAARGSKKKR